MAGQFYEGEKDSLLSQVASCLPKQTTPHPVRALLVPHAGFIYSGRVAGEVYASVLWTSSVILLGPNHTGEGKAMSLSCADRWRTPLGEVEVDRELARSILQKAPELEEDDGAHRFEHSLEVQLPFLQVLSKKTKIVPVTLGFQTPGHYKTFGEHLADAVESSGKEVIVIASSDMTHYESHERAKEKDHYAIQAILSVDPDELAKRVEEQNISMCGFAPALAMLSYVKRKRIPSGRLIRYQTSGDVTKDYSSVVGYAGILFI